MWKCPKTLRSLHKSTFILCFASFWEKLIWKMPHLVLRKIFQVFVNSLTADGRYPVEDWENLQFPMQMQLSEKKKINCLFHFCNLQKILNILKKSMMVIANIFPKLHTVKNFVIPLCENPRFGTSFDSQHVKVSQLLANLQESAFIMCFHHSEGSWFGNFLT